MLNLWDNITTTNLKTGLPDFLRFLTFYVILIFSIYVDMVRKVLLSFMIIFDFDIFQ